MENLKYPDLGMNSDIEFFDRIVTPDMDAFNNNNNIREAFHLALSMNSLLDWHWHSQFPNISQKNDKLKWKNFRTEMHERCPSLVHIQDLADASKHCGLDRHSMKLEKLEIRTGRYGVGGYNFEGGYGISSAYGSGIAHPLMKSEDGSVAWLSDIFRMAFEHWSSIIEPLRFRTRA